MIFVKEDVWGDHLITFSLHPFVEDTRKMCTFSILLKRLTIVTLSIIVYFHSNRCFVSIHELLCNMNGG